MAWVIDAASVVDLLSGGRRARRTWDVIGDDPLHAPDLITGEVVSALARRGRAGHPGVDAAVVEFGEMPLDQHPSLPLLTAAWARRDSIRVSDGFYVALARALTLPLVTSDARLGRVIEQQSLCGVRVIDGAP